MTNYSAVKETLSYHIYMWNMWSKAECGIIFNEPGQEWQYSLGEHIWDKWCNYCDKVGATAAPSMMVANLDETNLKKIIDRACNFYVGRANKV